MGPHRRIAPRHVLGQRQRQRGRLAAGLASALQRQPHSVGVRHIARQRIEDGRLQRGRAVALEQPQQRRAYFGGA